MNDTFQIPESLDPDDVLKLYMQPAAAAIADSMEARLLDLYVGFIAEPRVAREDDLTERLGAGE